MARVKIKGLNRVKEALKKAAQKYTKDDPNPKVTVGYTAPYAIYVHENMENYHPIGQAKYLSQPARENSGKYKQIVVNALRKGATLLQAMYMAGQELLKDSQPLVPVDTGFLKKSGFVQAGESTELVGEGIGVHVSNPNRRIHRKKA